MLGAGEKGGARNWKKEPDFAFSYQNGLKRKNPNYLLQQGSRLEQFKTVNSASWLSVLN